MLAPSGVRPCRSARATTCRRRRRRRRGPLRPADHLQRRALRSHASVATEGERVRGPAGRAPWQPDPTRHRSGLRTGFKTQHDPPAGGGRVVQTSLSVGRADLLDRGLPTGGSWLDHCLSGAMARTCWCALQGSATGDDLLPKLPLPTMVSHMRGRPAWNYRIVGCSTPRRTDPPTFADRTLHTPCGHTRPSGAGRFVDRDQPPRRCLAPARQT